MSLQDDEIKLRISTNSWCATMGTEAELIKTAKRSTLIHINQKKIHGIGIRQKPIEIQRLLCNNR